MKPAAFDYYRPSDVGDAIAALSEPGSKLIAGGQSLGPMLNLRLARPARLIDVAGLPELHGMQDRRSHWRIGAATTHSDIEDGRTPLGTHGLLPDVARQIAYRAIRNRGTVGGSLAHADPAADWPLALSVCGATIQIRGPQGEREVAARDFMTTAFTSVLRDDELILAVDVPKAAQSARWGYFKLCRKVGEFPIASAAVVLDGDSSRVFLGALADRPRPLPYLASALSRGPARGITASTLVQAVAEAAPEIDDIDRRIYVGCLTRAIDQACA
jgi:carbon-monoxide dehydrogenase medium subunit